MCKTLQNDVRVVCYKIKGNYFLIMLYIYVTEAMHGAYMLCSLCYHYIKEAGAYCF